MNACQRPYRKIHLCMTSCIASCSITVKPMSAPELYGGIGSLAVGVLFVVFPKPIGVVFSRLGQSIWKRHENDAVGRIRREFQKGLPFYSLDRIYYEKRAPTILRFLGVVFLIQAVVFLILSAVI